VAQAAVPVWVWWASLAVSTAATVYSQKQQASAVKAANEQKKTSAELETNSREIQRRKRLLTALASQNNKAGAGGVRATEGSFGNMAAESIYNSELGIATDKASASAYNKALDLNTRTAQQTSRISMVSTIAGAGMDAYSIGGTPSDGPQGSGNPNSPNFVGPPSPK
jgi:hypothetical protein